MAQRGITINYRIQSADDARQAAMAAAARES
jgi:hypothetical protein